MTSRIDQLAAFDESLDLARSKGMPLLPGTPFGLEHLTAMRRAIRPDFDEAKLGRWLGWAQCAIAASGIADLESMKRINSANTEPDPIGPSPAELERAKSARLRLRGGEGSPCFEYHDHALWKQAERICPRCSISHSEWLAIVKDPSTWLR